MKLGSLAASRPAYYDRNSTTSGAAYYGTVAPHTATTRWTVTCAAGKRIFVESIFSDITRITAATVAAQSYVAVTVVCVDGSGPTLCFGSLRSNTVYERSVSQLAGQIILNAADYIFAQTFDASTGGTCGYNVYQKHTVFDA